MNSSNWKTMHFGTSVLPRIMNWNVDQLLPNVLSNDFPRLLIQWKLRWIPPPPAVTSISSDLTASGTLRSGSTWNKPSSVLQLPFWNTWPHYPHITPLPWVCNRVSQKEDILETLRRLLKYRGFFASTCLTYPLKNWLASSLSAAKNKKMLPGSPNTTSRQ